MKRNENKERDGSIPSPCHPKKNENGKWFSATISNEMK